MNIHGLVFALTLIFSSHLLANETIELPVERPPAPEVKLSAELAELEESGEVNPSTGLELILIKDRPGIPAKFAVLSGEAGRCSSGDVDRCKGKQELLYVLTQNVSTDCGSDVYFGQAIGVEGSLGQSAIMLVDHTRRHCDDHVAAQWKVKLIEDAKITTAGGNA